tara:strand:- start:296 stop:847 length:552 start_codon:yes stop_codon:yes gene_type:complete
LFLGQLQDAGEFLSHQHPGTGGVLDLDLKQPLLLLVVTGGGNRSPQFLGRLAVLPGPLLFFQALGGLDRRSNFGSRLLQGGLLLVTQLQFLVNESVTRQRADPHIPAASPPLLRFDRLQTQKDKEQGQRKPGGAHGLSPRVRTGHRWHDLNQHDTTCPVGRIDFCDRFSQAAAIAIVAVEEVG